MGSSRTRVTRRAALGLVGAGIAGVAAVCAGVATAILDPAFVTGAPPAELVGTTSAADPQVVAPVGGAGLYDVDPDQGGVSQDPAVAVRGDVASLPEGMEL